jgi:hypothetical protein
VCLGSVTGQLVVVDLRSGAVREQWEGHDGPVTGIKIRAGSQVIASHTGHIYVMSEGQFSVVKFDLADFLWFCVKRWYRHHLIVPLLSGTWRVLELAQQLAIGKGGPSMTNSQKKVSRCRLDARSRISI